MASTDGKEFFFTACQNGVAFTPQNGQLVDEAT
jgi:hypothetical protein